jgi:cation:H+ antiporter
VLGSNLFNLAILAVDDTFYLKGPLLARVDKNHLITAACAIIMTSIAVLGILHPERKKRFIVSFNGIFLAVVFLLNLVLLYLSIPR